MLGEAYFDSDGTAFSRLRDGQWCDPVDQLYIPWSKVERQHIRLVAEVIKPAKPKQGGTKR